MIKQSIIHPIPPPSPHLDLIHRHTKKPSRGGTSRVQPRHANRLRGKTHPQNDKAISTVAATQFTSWGDEGDVYPLPGAEVAKSLSDGGGRDPVISCIATPALVDKPFEAGQMRRDDLGFSFYCVLCYWRVYYLKRSIFATFQDHFSIRPLSYRLLSLVSCNYLPIMSVQQASSEQGFVSGDSLQSNQVSQLQRHGYLFGKKLTASLSPFLHNVIYQDLGLKWGQVRLDSADIPGFLELAQHPDFYGTFHSLSPN